MTTNSTHSMGDMMSDSECSEMTDSSSAASSSSSDSEQSSQSLEPARILKHNLELPKSLCENPRIFHEFFSLETWKCLPDHMQDQLKAFLPRFDGIVANENEEHIEMNVTLQKLFTNQITRFGASPLVAFQRHLEEGNYRPDISRLRANIRKSQRREQRFQQCERVSRLAKSLVVSREKLLRAAYDGINCQALNSMADKVTNDVPKLTSTAAAERAKKRYFEDISAIMEDVGLDLQLSDDENYPEGPPVHLTRKQQKYLTGTQYGALSPGSEPRIISTMSMRNSSNVDKSLAQHCSTSMSDDAYRQLLAQHKMRKIEDADHPDLDTADIKLGDIYVRTQNAAGRRPLLLPKQAVTSKKAQAAAAAAIPTPPVKIEADAIKVESEVTIAVNDEQPSFELPALDAEHINLTQSYLNDNVQKTVATIAHDAIKFEEENDENVEVKIEVKTEAIKVEQQKVLPPIVAATKAIHQTNAIGGEIKGKKRQNSASIPTDRSPKKPLLTPNTTVNEEPIKVEPMVVAYSASNTTTSIVQQPPISKAVATATPVPPIATNPVQVNASPVQVTANQLQVNVNSSQCNDLQMTCNLDGIDIMHLPVDLDDSGGNIDILSDIDMKPELIRETHACFLSLIRDIFCSTPDHRTTAENLRDRVSTWLANPLTALNDWFGEADSWLDLLTSAIHFLAGEFIDQPDEFVPYVEYKAQLNIYQWIGAGRDNDQHLQPLCEYWLSRRNEMGTKPPPKNAAQTESSRGKSPRALTQSHVQVRNPSRNHTFDIDFEDSLSSGGGGGSGINSSSFERIASPPPPRYPTDWTVQKETADEIHEFREQERRRFDSPHLSFTYRMHGYESVVGPVKGIYTQIPALTKARGHNMLTADRPNFVTILTLVRDATARLPNGEGTRADICELLKSSQYISSTAAESVLQTIVSGALDRMHTEHDPCVRYDAKRKIWIYLHRNRTEEEFDRMHQQYQGHSKHKKQTTRKNKSLKGSATLSKSPNEVHQPTTDKCVAKVIATPATSISPTTPIAAQVQVTTTSAASPPLPALSSIQVSPTLANKIITVQKKSLVKPELVPIQVSHDTQLEPIDVETTHSVSTSSPTTVQKPSPRVSMPLPSLIVDKTPKMSTATLNLIASNSTQIKVSTPSGIQTVHVSAAGHALIKPPMLNTNQVQNRSPKVQPPPLIASKSMQQVNATQLQVNASQCKPSPCIMKTTLPALTSAQMPRMSLLHTQQTQSPQNINVSLSKTIIRNASVVPAGTSLIAPTLQQQTVPLKKQICSINAGDLIFQSQPQTQIRTNTRTATGSEIVPEWIRTTTRPPTSTELVRNRFETSTEPTRLLTTSQTNAPMVVQKIIAVSKAASTSTASASAVGTITPPGTSLINPTIIQMSRKPTLGLTPTQQQNLLQSIKQRAQTSPQSLIIKQQQVLQQIQKQMQQPTTHQQPTITRTIKAGTSLIQQSNSTTATTTQLTTSPITAVRTVSANNPLVGKVLTDASGQIISLESLLQKQVTVNSTPTLRLTGSKPGQTTNLIQLAGTPGSPITQYAVVSQGRNLISMAQPRVITTQATGIATSNATTATINSSGQLVAVSGVKTAGGISVLTSTATSSAPKTDFVKIGGNAAYSKLITMTSVPTAATTSATVAVAASAAPQNVMRYKTGGTSFRIMNASNLNIAHIGGKPVIIASKAPNSTIIGSSNVVTSDYKSQPISTNISPRFTSSRINTRTIVNSSAATTTPTRTVVLSSTGQTIKVHSPSLISAPSSTVDSGGGGAKVTVAASGLPSTQQVVLGPSNIKNVIKGTNLTTSPGQRVVLAVQGGGQILLPPNFQGGSINLKSLQGLKMIPIQQSQASQIQQSQQIVTNTQVTRAPNSTTSDS